MTTYSQLSDAELGRKVLELVGYSVDSTALNYTSTSVRFWLQKNGQDTLNSWGSEAEAWSHAPNPFEPNFYMGLVDELRMIGKRTKKSIKIMDCIDDSWFFVFGDLDTTINDFASQNINLARAVCEVYCIVKEGKG